MWALYPHEIPDEATSPQNSVLLQIAPSISRTTIAPAPTPFFVCKCSSFVAFRADDSDTSVCCESRIDDFEFFVSLKSPAARFLSVWNGTCCTKRFHVHVNCYCVCNWRSKRLSSAFMTRFLVPSVFRTCFVQKHAMLQCHSQCECKLTADDYRFMENEDA